MRMQRHNDEFDAKEAGWLHNVILERHEDSALVQSAQVAVELDLGLGGVFPFSLTTFGRPPSRGARLL
jgi:hypothetical protein